jgi:hypothetical protein
MYGNSAYGYLDSGDVILEIDGVKVFNNGTVSLKLNPSSKHKYRYNSTPGRPASAIDLTSTTVNV